MRYLGIENFGAGNIVVVFEGGAVLAKVVEDFSYLWGFQDCCEVVMR